MKKLFRLTLLIITMLAIYGGVITQIWSYSLIIATSCLLIFLLTLPSKKTPDNHRRSSDKSRFLGGGFIGDGHSSSSDFGGGECGGGDGGC